MHAAQASPIVLFDGVCNLCSASVRFIARRDPSAVFRFAAQQSDAARPLLDQFNLSQDDRESVVLIESGQAFTRSTAALRIVRRLRFPWPLLYGLIVIPRPIRDWVYGFIARRRYRWFGRRETCMTSTPPQSARFLE